MQEVTADIKPINVQQLDGEMRAVFQARYHGLSTDQKSIRFFVDDDLSKSDVEVLEALYEAHTPTETDEQVIDRKRTDKQDQRQFLRGFDQSEVKTLDDALPYLEAIIRLIAQDE